MKRLPILVLAMAAAGSFGIRAADQELVPSGIPRLPFDRRVGKPKDHNGYFPWKPPASKEDWEKRRQEVREQVLVATGLWPMPEKIPLKPVIHGKIDRDSYTIEKVFFASYPGHYVCGNLYRPKGNPAPGESSGGSRPPLAMKLPAVLCPHGHWANGRFFDAGEKTARAEIKQGTEKTMEGARYPSQAICAQLARMGCVVFHYDMVGYADSKPIAHRGGFTDAAAELRLQNTMGLQTFNSIRALDFLMSLPEVAPKRVGVTGHSGGGTQTFILCAVDDRPTAAFPAVMVSTAMQGGCVCENCSYLRIGTGNIELAALFAPKPLGMTGARDWTIDIETKGLPELKALYKLYGAEDRVMARCFPQFDHNYNQVSREVMYNWFNKHLGLGQPEPVVEKPFVPVPPKELSVFDAEHPLPNDAAKADKLRAYLSEASDKQLAGLLPKNAESLKEFQRVVGTALRVMINDRPPLKNEFKENSWEPLPENDGFRRRMFHLGKPGPGDDVKSLPEMGEQVPVLELQGPEFDGTVVVWIHPDGKASLFKERKLVPAARRILDKKSAILAPDVFWTGEARGVVVHLELDQKKLQAFKLSPENVRKTIDGWLLSELRWDVRIVSDFQFLLCKEDAVETAKILSDVPIKTVDGKPVLIRDVGKLVTKEFLPIDRGYAGYTFGYNRPLLANRVHDIVRTVAYAKNQAKAKKVHLAGFDKAGPWVVLARALCGDAVARTAADANQFRFDTVTSVNDEMMLPGALKYGGLPAFAALCAPHELFLHNQHAAGLEQWLKPAYQASGKPENLQALSEKAELDKVLDWLLR